MDFNRFFTYHDCKIDLNDVRSDKIGDVTVVATKKNIFFKAGDKVTIPLYQNHIHGRMFGVEPVRDFITFFDTGDDFLDFLFDKWEENKPTVMRYE